jgi:hypothetical protein
MSTTGEHRLAIEAAETLAALIDQQLDVIGLMALQPAVQHRADLMTALEAAAEQMIHARQIVFHWRARLHESAGGKARDV